MKIIKRIIFALLLILICVVLVFVGNGYSMYKDALKEMPLEEKVASIKEKDNYTKIEEMPKIYKNAVVSVEDHRFYKHFGIDIIAVGRAAVNDIKEMRFASYFGDGYDTVKEASKGYFDKEPNEMTDYEAILLAGIPNAPSVYAPTKNPELAKQRQKRVMNKMVEYKYLTKEEADEILNSNE